MPILPDPTDPSVVFIDDATDATWGAHMGASTLVNVHSEALCYGQVCVIHNPSPHHMREWPLTWRGDKGMMERACPHRVGHPDPDDLAYQVAAGRDWAGLHGCDGCCATPEDV